MSEKLLKISVVQVVNPESQERINLGTIKLKYSLDHSEIMFLDEEVIEVPNGKKLYFSATYELRSENISVFVREEEIHIFTGVFHWSYSGTYFAFLLSDGAFTE